MMDDEAVKSYLVQFFADKDQKFWSEQNGKYIIDWSSFPEFKKIGLICMKKSAITSGTTQ